MGSQGFFHGIFMLNFPTRPSQIFKLLGKKKQEFQRIFQYTSFNQPLYQKKLKTEQNSYKQNTKRMEQKNRSRFFMEMSCICQLYFVGGGICYTLFQCKGKLEIIKCVKYYLHIFQQYFLCEIINVSKISSPRKRGSSIGIKST